MKYEEGKYKQLIGTKFKHKQRKYYRSTTYDCTGADSKNCNLQLLPIFKILKFGFLYWKFIDI